MSLHPSFLAAPIAHRGLHDLSEGRPENGLSAVRAAVDAGYGLELDLQISADGVAMVFHDYELDRVTGESGQVKRRSAAELGQITLIGSDDRIPRLSEVLELVDGRVPDTAEEEARSLMEQIQAGNLPPRLRVRLLRACVRGARGGFSAVSVVIGRSSPTHLKNATPGPVKNNHACLF